MTVSDAVASTLGILLREDCGDDCIKIFGPFFFDTSGTVILNEINVCEKWIEIHNPTPNDVDISTYWLCNFPSYAEISSLSLISGSLNMQPGGYTVVGFPSMGDLSGEVGLYINNSDFGNSNNIIDYVQYNSGNNARANVAVSGGVWDDVNNFVTAETGAGCLSIGLNPTETPNKGGDTNSDTWCIQTPSQGEDNTECLDVVANAIDDAFVTTQDVDLVENVSTNDIPCNVGVTTYGVVTGSEVNGTVTAFDVSTGAFTFQPTASFTGTATFSIQPIL